MANSPVTPDNVKAVVASTTSSVCGNMISTLLRFPVLIYQFIAWLLNTDGSVSDEFQRQIVKPGDLIFSSAPLATSSSRILADGSTVSRATYADLFAAIGVIYGPGDGLTTFQLPDYRNFFPVGAGDTYALGSTGGEAEHILDITEIPAVPVFNPYIEDPAQINAGPTLQGGGVPPVGAPSSQIFPSLSQWGGDGSVTTPTPANTTFTALSPAAAHPIIPPYVAAYIYLKT